MAECESFKKCRLTYDCTPGIVHSGLRSSSATSSGETPLFSNSRNRTLAVRAALTLSCLAGAGVWPPKVQPATAQTGKTCSNTGCSGVDRCLYYGGVKCFMTNNSCTNTGC